MSREVRKPAPHTVVHADRRWVDNGKVVTSAGLSAGIDASLHIVTRLLGKDAATSTALHGVRLGARQVQDRVGIDPRG